MNRTFHAVLSQFQTHPEIHLAFLTSYCDYQALLYVAIMAGKLFESSLNNHLNQSNQSG